MGSKEEQFYYKTCNCATGLICFSVAEGKEAFEKAKGKECDCCQ